MVPCFSPKGRLAASGREILGMRNRSGVKKNSSLVLWILDWISRALWPDILEVLPSVRKKRSSLFVRFFASFFTATTKLYASI